jgi:hypothetical protein
MILLAAGIVSRPFADCFWTFCCRRVARSRTTADAPFAQVPGRKSIRALRRAARSGFRRRPYSISFIETLEIQTSEGGTLKKRASTLGVPHTMSLKASVSSKYFIEIPLRAVAAYSTSTAGLAERISDAVALLLVMSESNSILNNS